MTRPDNFADQYVDQKISISDYSLSASVACGKFCCAMVSGSRTRRARVLISSRRSCGISYNVFRLVHVCEPSFRS